MADEMRGKHLVTNNPQNMTESMLNFAYAKNERVYLSYADGTEDIDLCEYVSQLTKKQGCNLSADDVMQGSCIEGCDCEVAILYTLAVQAAELRERLKHYESLEEQGLLQTLPCKVGEKVWLILETLTGKRGVYESKVICHIKTEKTETFSCFIDCAEIGNSIEFDITEVDDFIFRSKEEAEQKLEEMRGKNDA